MFDGDTKEGFTSLLYLKLSTHTLKREREREREKKRRWKGKEKRKVESYVKNIYSSSKELKKNILVSVRLKIKFFCDVELHTVKHAKIGRKNIYLFFKVTP